MLEANTLFTVLPGTKLVKFNWKYRIPWNIIPSLFFFGASLSSPLKSHDVET